MNTNRRQCDTFIHSAFVNNPIINSAEVKYFVTIPLTLGLDQTQSMLIVNKFTPTLSYWIIVFFPASLSPADQCFASAIWAR